jgi:hypothetical protein
VGMHVAVKPWRVSVKARPVCKRQGLNTDLMQGHLVHLPACGDMSWNVAQCHFRAKNYCQGYGWGIMCSQLFDIASFDAGLLSLNAPR